MADQHQRDLLSKRKSRRRRLALAAVTVLALGLADGWMTRSPEPYFAARHGELAAVRTEGSEGVGTARLTEYRLTSTSGLEVEISILRPQQVSSRLPAILLLGGHRTGRDAARLVPSEIGVIVAAISYPYDGPAKLRGMEVLTALPGIRRALLDTPPALGLAVDFLLSDPAVDPARVELAGISLGAPLVCAAGAVDARVSRVWAIHGGGALGRLLDHNLAREVESPWLRKPLAVFGSWLLSPLEPETFVPRISPRPVVLVNARQDERIPRSSVEALYRAARDPKELIWLEGGHVGPRKEETVSRLVELVLSRMAEAPTEDLSAPLDPPTLER